MVLSPGTALSVNQTAASRAVESVSHIWAYVCISVERHNIKHEIYQRKTKFCLVVHFSMSREQK